MARRVDRIVDIDHAPLAVQSLPIGAAIAAAAAVVDVDHREAAARPVLDQQFQRGIGRIGRAAVTGYEQRRPGAFGSLEIRVHRRIEKRMREVAAFSREADRLGHRDIGGIDLHAARGAQHAMRAVFEIERDDRFADGRGTADDDGFAAAHMEIADRPERRRDRFETVRLGVEHREMRVAVALVETDDASRRVEPIRAHAEQPLRRAELRFHRP